MAAAALVGAAARTVPAARMEASALTEPSAPLRNPGPAPVAGPREAAGMAIDLVDQSGGVSRAVAMSGSTAYVGVGQRIEAVDVSAPDAPRVLGRVGPLPGPPEDVVVVGDHVLVAADRLVSIDVSDPAAPRIDWQLDTFPGTHAVAADAEAGRAYVLSSRGIGVIDIANPARPVGKGALPGPGEGIAARGTTVVVATGDGIRVVDATDPARPVEAARLEHDEAWATSGLAFAGDRLIVVGEGVLRVVDMADLRRPRFMATVAVPDSLTPNGPPRSDVAVSGTLAVVTGRTDLHVIDLAAAPPVPIGRLQGRGFLEQLAASGSLALVADRDHGLHAVSFGGSRPPRDVGQLVTRAAAGVAADAVRAYAFAGNQDAASDAVRVVDVDPTGDLVPRGFAPAPTIRDLAPAGRYVFGAAGESGTVVVDVADANAPSLAAVVLPPNRAVRAVAADLQRVYAGDPFAGLAVLDARRPSELPVLGTVPVDGWPADLVAAGRHVVVAAGFAGVAVVDASDPAAPRVVGRFNPGAGPDGAGLWDARQVAVSGTTAWVATANGRLLALDLRDPAAPRQLSATEVEGDPAGIAVDGDRVWLSTNAAGLPPASVQLFDGSDPRQPQPLARLRVPGDGVALAVVRQVCVVASGDAGLVSLVAREVADPTEEPPPTDVPVTPGPTATSEPTPIATATPSDGICLPIGLRRFALP